MGPRPSGPRDPDGPQYVYAVRGRGRALEAGPSTAQVAKEAEDQALRVSAGTAEGFERAKAASGSQTELTEFYNSRMMIDSGLSIDEAALSQSKRAQNPARYFEIPYSVTPGGGIGGTIPDHQMDAFFEYWDSIGQDYPSIWVRNDLLDYGHGVAIHEAELAAKQAASTQVERATRVIKRADGTEVRILPLGPVVDEAADAWQGAQQQMIDAVAETKIARNRLEEIGERIDELKPDPEVVAGGRYRVPKELDDLIKEADGIAARMVQLGDEVAPQVQLQGVESAKVLREADAKARSVLESLEESATPAAPGVVDRPMWHGSATKFDAFEAGYGDERALFGFGVYTTDSLGTAIGYSKKRPAGRPRRRGAGAVDPERFMYNVVWREARPPRILDLEATMPDKVRGVARTTVDSLEWVTDYLPIGEWDELVSVVDDPASTFEDFYQKLVQVFAESEQPSTEFIDILQEMSDDLVEAGVDAFRYLSLIHI